MSGLIGGFDADSTPKGNAIPEKTQATCLITEISDEESKKSPGNWMIRAKIEVVDGPFKGMLHTENFNVVNTNEVAVRMGKAKLAQLCLAVGCPRPTSNNDLANKPFRVTFGKPKPNDSGELQTQIQKFDPVGGSQAVTQNLGPQSAAKPAWAKS